uniref:Uncharacterized protein n=1 Tax=Caenorhabditis japonica TaxID=281687 RepID=A0A8R1EMN0_CAEJA
MSKTEEHAPPLLQGNSAAHCFPVFYSTFYIQRRGFRTRRQTFGVGSGGKQPEEAKSPLAFFTELLAGKKTKTADGGVEKWNQYETDLKKLPEGQQRTYTDGFVKGLLSNGTTGTGKDAKKSNTLTRFYIFLVFCIFFGYLTGSEFFCFVWKPAYFEIKNAFFCIFMQK